MKSTLLRQWFIWGFLVYPDQCSELSLPWGTAPLPAATLLYCTHPGPSHIHLPLEGVARTMLVGVEALRALPACLGLPSAASCSRISSSFLLEAGGQRPRWDSM